MFKHYSVLLNETVDKLNVNPDLIYVDATLGGGGHSKLIASKLSSKGHLYCFDQDEVAISNAKLIFDKVDNVTVIKSNFVNFKSELVKLGVQKIDGIIFDLGMSSMQIDESERGFSYISDGPLDMRMDNSSSITAKTIIDTYSVGELSTIFKKYGEEKLAKHYANIICENRKIRTTKQLSDLIIEKTPKKVFYSLNSHPAIRVFQALRIEVNKELDVFEKAINDCYDMINVNGRICVISFHSLEDRIAKYYFNKWSQVNEDFSSLPVIPDEYLAKYKKISKKPILPSKSELDENSRSQSAKLRVVERI